MGELCLAAASSSKYFFAFFLINFHEWAWSSYQFFFENFEKVSFGAHTKDRSVDQTRSTDNTPTLHHLVRNRSYRTRPGRPVEMSQDNVDFDWCFNPKVFVGRQFDRQRIQSASKYSILQAKWTRRSERVLCWQFSARENTTVPTVSNVCYNVKMYLYFTYALLHSRPLPSCPDNHVRFSLSTYGQGLSKFYFDGLWTKVFKTLPKLYQQLWLARTRNQCSRRLAEKSKRKTAK